MFTHINENNQPSMVDVSQKEVTHRVATAEGLMFLGKEIIEKFQTNDIISKKGPVFSTAIIAAAMGVKKTSDLIPFCHPVALEGIETNIQIISNDTIKITSTVSCSGKTGVEMEALTGVHIACLTIHDMCKSLNPFMEVRSIQLVRKTGGKNGIIEREK